MSEQNTRTGMSRRRFLGGSAAAIGGLSLGALHPEMLLAQRGRGAMGPPPEAGFALLGMGMERYQPKGAPDEAFWKMIRHEYNIVDDMIYMNNGTLGPMPNVVVEANYRFLREIAADPRNPLGAMIEPTREKLAAFVGANADEIVINRSTTEGEKQFCHGLDLKEGDEIVMSTHEHGGGTGSWHAREKRDRIKLVTVPIPAPPESVDQIVGLIEKAITPRTKVILVSYPVYVTGLLMPVKPLADLAHRRGLLLTVDGAHSLGMLDLNLHAMGMDHFTTAGQKWLMAGTGNGLSYFKRDIQDRVWPDMLGGGPENPNEGARKYERSGQRNIPSALGMGVAADFQMAIGKQNVQNRVRFLAARFKDGVKAIPGANVYTSSSDEMSGGLSTVSVTGVPKANLIKAAMDRAGIFITQSGLNDGSCRISTHIYTSPSDVDRLLEVIKYVAANTSKFNTPTAAAANNDE